MAVKTQYGEVQDHNYTASEQITGGQLVRFTGNRTVGVGAATDPVAGWCPYDVAPGNLAPVYRKRRVPVVVAAVVAAGNQAVPAAAGQAAAVPAPGSAGASPTAAEFTAAINDTRRICGHFETGGAAGTTQALVLY